MIERIKRILMVTGLLTILAGTALVGLIVYVWWDTRNASGEPETDTGFESGTDFDTSAGADSPEDEPDMGTTDTETDTDAESGVAAD